MQETKQNIVLGGPTSARARGMNAVMHCPLPQPQLAKVSLVALGPHNFGCIGQLSLKDVLNERVKYGCSQILSGGFLFGVHWPDPASSAYRLYLAQTFHKSLAVGLCNTH